MTTHKKKLIEVALPLEAINVASAREKSIRHGHPSTLHLWWARRPLAAARAVIFSQMVDDPSEYVDVLLSDPKLKSAAARELKKRLAERAAKQDLSGEEPTDAEPTLEGVIADLERQRLFKILEELVLWENTTNEQVLERARTEIWQSWRRTCAEHADHPRSKELFDRDRLPGFHDPFAGGGALPLEAQRLGLEAHASDLNPVAVLINKAMIEIPPRFAGRPPVRPESKGSGKKLVNRSSGDWRGAQGLAEDVRHYGRWMRDEAEQRTGQLYPKVRVTEEMVHERKDLAPYEGRELTVIAWLWARTVKSPNPAFADVEVPLASNFMLATKKGKEAWVEPAIEAGGYRFTVNVGRPADPEVAKAGTKLGRGASFRCLMSGAPIDGDYIKAEGKAGRMGARLMTIVAEGDRQRVYLGPTAEHEAAARAAKPKWRPEGDVPARLTGGTCVPYGLSTWGDLFTPRQLVALTTFSDLVGEATERIRHDALAAGLPDDLTPLRDGGTGATAYAEAVATYLAIGVARYANACTTICSWNPGQKKEDIRFTFSRQALPMTWDYAEGNPFSASSGNYSDNIETWLYKALQFMPSESALGYASQEDAAVQVRSTSKVVSSDPPYYDNIGYADLSDFFYVWHRRAMRLVFPELFATLAVPKAEELVATPYRHGGRDQAEAFFMNGMTHAMARLAEQAHSAFPVTIYYAFKQSETASDTGTASTGWETFLDAVIQAGFGVSGTWPMHTERGGRSIGVGTNALASSIILVCRPRAADAPTTSRREFLTALKGELPVALAQLQKSNIAPVDLAQAAIGPGMAVYTRYVRVLESNGSPLTVRTALALINQVLDETLAEQEGDFDADTRWALSWFDQSGFDEGEFGQADVLARAKNTSVQGLVDAGLLASKGGKVRLLEPSQLPQDWDPTTDTRLTVWEMVHHLIRRLEAGGESAAAELAGQLGPAAEAARELAYRLYSLCERKKRAPLALAYNALVQSWPEIVRLAREAPRQPAEPSLFAEQED
ncbi:hypothetical protein Pla163_02280 [Planctomycetes bacterium Pla163]|uniref:DUF1156 domain-containing protein n=1 Tax=Rohdeia mirabilis TaxID=2528008 RepID=A0A518CV97_9BACT|nr:hypothetical protein Pla163_02280 [Planctomycetes bacterium Pla163]